MTKTLKRNAPPGPSVCHVAPSSHTWNIQERQRIQRVTMGDPKAALGKEGSTWFNNPSTSLFEETSIPITTHVGCQPLSGRPPADHSNRLCKLQPSPQRWPPRLFERQAVAAAAPKPHAVPFYKAHVSLGNTILKLGRPSLTHSPLRSTLLPSKLRNTFYAGGLQLLVWIFWISTNKQTRACVLKRSPNSSSTEETNAPRFAVGHPAKGIGLISPRCCKSKECTNKSPGSS